MNEIQKSDFNVAQFTSKVRKYFRQNDIGIPLSGCVFPEKSDRACLMLVKTKDWNDVPVNTLFILESKMQVPPKILFGTKQTLFNKSISIEGDTAYISFCTFENSGRSFTVKTEELFHLLS